MRIRSRKAMGIAVLPVLLLLVAGDQARARDVSLSGQLSSWITRDESAADEISGGLRYIPELRMTRSLSDERNFDGLFALNGYAAVPGNRNDLKLYRVWLRYAGPRWELRAGLQKINFGPARILRSLMWFDRVDVRDPLQLTEGVYGILYRRYTLNNASLWFWDLSGNDDRKGLERHPSEKELAELGGRYQFPVSRGEMAVTYHRRYVDPEDWARIMVVSPPVLDGLEQRLALDGIWDIGPGVWFEAAASKLKVNSNTDFWQEYLTIGADYTFDYGPGIHWLVEHFLYSSGPEANHQDNISRVTAVSVDFSVAMLDTLTAIGYYDWNRDRLYSFLGWQRTLDNWLVHVGVFESVSSDTSDFSGSGLRLMFTYNH